MRKLVLSFVLLMLMASIGYAATATFAVACSSNTATAVRDSNYWRKEIVFHNPNSTYSVFVATYPATSSTGLFEIEPLGYWWPEFPDGGVYYILSEAGDQAVTTVSGIERW